MDPARLRLLRELRDRGSVAAVAAALHVSPSAVSQQIAALQAGVGLPLTVRRGRRLTLTDAGDALADAAARIDEALAGARDALATFATREDRIVRVTAFHSAGLALFGPLLSALADGLEVSLRDEDVALEDFPALTADHDLVVAHRLAHDPPWPAGRVDAVPLFVEAFDVALPSGHPLAAAASVPPERLRELPWVSVHPGFPLEGVVEHLAATVGAPLDVRHRINDFALAAEVVRQGRAAAVMPRITAAAFARDGVVLRPIEGVELVRHVDVLARPDVLALRPVRSVLETLRRAARTVAEAS